MFSELVYHGYVQVSVHGFHLFRGWKPFLTSEGRNYRDISPFLSKPWCLPSILWQKGSGLGWTRSNEGQTPSNFGSWLSWCLSWPGIKYHISCSANSNCANIWQNIMTPTFLTFRYTSLFLVHWIWTFFEYYYLSAWRLILRFSNTDTASSFSPSH